MPKQLKKRSRKTGLPPGALVHIGEKWSEKARISVMQYNDETLREKELADVRELTVPSDTSLITWIHVDGLHDTAILAQLGEKFDLHPLLLEDILNTDHRPKMEDMGSYIFVVLKTFAADASLMAEVKPEQVSLVFGSNFVLSLQEKESKLLLPIRERIRQGKGKIRKLGADYLAHAILDTVVDSYFSILEDIGDEIEACEEDLVNRPGTAVMKRIQYLKRNMIILRKSVWPLREAVAALERSESPLIAESTNIYFRDVYDHTIQVMDTIETYRDSLSGMLDIYLSSLSNRMNEIMKVLTIIATIFIPLTFIAGVYGMNFEYMPELKWRWGYFIVWGVIIFIALFMLKWFRKNRWL
ncbi:MAG TPA: magnesium/cobalt transporter CorA [Syntrophales bacterium]|nr:magnesium/cobalt transporter CorA [Syntrophales bacterium]